MALQYEKEINEILEAMSPDWAETQAEREEFRDIILKETKTTKESLDDMLKKGVKNGYPVEIQTEAIIKMFKMLNSNGALKIFSQMRSLINQSMEDK